MSNVAVSQVMRSQPQQLLHISNVQMQSVQQQGNQIVQMSPVSHAQSPQMLTVVSSVSSPLMPNSSIQMHAPSSVAVSQAVTSISATQQMSVAASMSQGLHSPTNTIVNQLSNLQNTSQVQANKLAFVQQHLLIQGQQPGQQNTLLNPQQQQAVILQRRGAIPPQQRILLQQQLVAGGVTTAHWRPGNIVSTAFTKLNFVNMYHYL